MTILIIAEHDHATLSDQTAKAVSAASQVGGDIHVLVAGKDAKAAADAAARLDGVTKVLLAEGDEYANRLAEPLAALAVSLAGDYDTLMAPATTSGKNVMPRVAALLDVMQISDIIEVISADTFKRPIYAGNALQTVKSTDASGLSTVCAPLALRKPADSADGPRLKPVASRRSGLKSRSARIADAE